ncbi:MAG: MerR family transcriptional regulator [Cloacibacillus porcorum]|uniref:MerR family transcriptional regulator n=1 Tax=Cloacibacillus porcorum TaxID=1197717 RepID=UPI0023F427C9|nr:MerR family transcriptional regulator [Cloacibacillus porcorum]MCD7876970.1 MerR family transcriptional regulator [Cloacibacillus porcorum]
MTISEAAERTGLSADTLRYYERIGLIPPVPRTESGLRAYGGETIEWINLIQQLKEIVMPLDAILNYVKLAMLGSGTRQERKVILLETRRSLMTKIDVSAAVSNRPITSSNIMTACCCRRRRAPSNAGASLRARRKTAPSEKAAAGRSGVCPIRTERKDASPPLTAS